ncbi:MAG: S1 RNA-binding domain-containing protein, partial [Firmicutes bacterium]|nr:S1 RNA-binding domain-containing protein [Bacillota bacterium]
MASSMEELLASTGYKFRGFKRGETVTGKVVEASGKTVFIDVGGKAEAIVSEQEYELARDYFRSLKPGDEVTGVVLVSENDAGQVVLSLRKAAVDTRWKAFEQAMADESTITVKGKEVTKGGLLVDMDGIYGFIPSSQFGKQLEANAAAAVGKTLQVKVIEIDRPTNRLVLSEKMVSEAEEIAQKRRALEGVKVGGEYGGVVVGMVPFGIFVELFPEGKAKKKSVDKEDSKLEGLVHISEISWEKIDDINKLLKEGDKVQVQVIGVDEDNGKLALSIKRLSSDPWLKVASSYKVDSKHKGVVTKIVPYGVLVRLESGIEGLIHASKIPANTTFKEGQEVDVDGIY